jgi:hypothetical protein
VSLRRLRLPKGGLTAGQKSAEGILGHDVGKASKELSNPLANQFLTWSACARWEPVHSPVVWLAA